ncbi:DihydroCaffeic Acid Receptor [Ditylenchus destructor]|uniref:DihydroCaffeic Acid Receptor n=1 Tax=Ditylenchus destructor TaxID=166010 RepID=A0AAD4RB69_9BILA|nr:DihydroCaffeic Acid Receptor [Ditylenchus destructor]
MSLSNECFHNIATQWTPELEEQTESYRFYQGILTLPVAIIGLALNSVYIISASRVIYQHRVSRKFYVLQSNRAMGDVLACLVSFAFSEHVVFARHISLNVVQLLNTLFVGSFWSAMTSYVSMGLLKLYGYARPFDYKVHVTMRRCIWLIILSWVVFAIFVIFVLTMITLSKISPVWITDGKWLNRTAEAWLASMYWFRNMLTIFLYFFVIICFLITVIFLRRARRSSKFIHQITNNRRSVKAARRYFRIKLIKMALSVASLAVFHLPYTVWAILLEWSNDQCFLTGNYDKMQPLMGVVRICLLLRITVDAMVQIATDRRIRTALLVLLRIRNDSSLPDVSSCPTPRLSPSLRSVRSQTLLNGENKNRGINVSLRSIRSQCMFSSQENRDSPKAETVAQRNGVTFLFPG